MLICRSSAKVNLTLDILNRRADGYHELQSVVHTIGLWDRLIFEPNRSGQWSLQCDESTLQTEDNLCLKAARAWHEAASTNGTSWSGTHITLHKTIPNGAGLGGGSGNAAATLRTLDVLYGSDLSEATLENIGAKLGADVPLFLRGGCVLMEGIGEKLTSLPRLEGWLVLLQPPQRISTPAAYRAWDESDRPSSRKSRELAALLAANGLTLAKVASTLQNDLTAAAQNHGIDVAALSATLRDAGALGAAMTGSGSAVFGLFADAATATAAAASLRTNVLADNAGIRENLDIYVVPFCKNGIEIEEPAG